MNETKKVAALANIAAAVWAIFCVGFILLDLKVFGWTMAQVSQEIEGWEGLGVAIIIALCLIFDLPATAINAIFQFVCGGLLLAWERRGKGVHKVLRAFAVIAGGLTTLIHVFFAYCFFEYSCVLWGILVAISALSALAAPILLLVAHRKGKIVQNTL